MATTSRRTLFALLVGIDSYANGVPQLKGCVNDVNAIETLLQESYSDLTPQIVKLTNEAGTRNNIISGFRTHLSRAKATDSVLFYFSGHGSRENAPEEFWAAFPTRKNETLVCYDSRLKGGFDLADKEIAVLLDELWTNKSHIVVCLDACHSGSGTRDSVQLTAIRQVDKYANGRSLSSYLDGYYLKQLKYQGKIIVPTATHVLLSASQNDEKAYETAEKHGLFTRSLIAGLTKMRSGGFTYSELVQNVAIRVRTVQKTQHPNLEFFGDFNPHTLFLTGTAIDRTRTFPIYFDENDQLWKVDKGSVDGLSLENLSPQFWVFDRQVTDFIPEKRISEACVSNVQPKRSIINLTKPLNKSLQYIGFQVDGGPKQATIYHELKATEGIFALFNFQKTDNQKEADYCLLRDNQGFTLIHQLSKKVIAKDESLENINIVLQKIARWETLIKLRNLKTRLLTAGIELELRVSVNDDEMVFSGEEAEITLIQNEEGETETRYYSIHARNNSGRDLHLKLVFISPLYGIRQLKQEIVPKGQGVILINSRLGFFPEQAEDTESIGYFKLFASTEEIDLSPFEQANFSLNQLSVHYQEELRRDAKGDGKFIDELGGSTTTVLDWCTKAIRLRLIKSTNKVGANTVSLANGAITFRPHSMLNANVSFIELFSASRGIESTEAILPSCPYPVI